MRRFIWICLLAAATAAHGEDRSRARSEAQAGDRAYEAGDFPQAIVHYESALAAGLDHADVHYNLGNAHYKRGELGRAIAAYERALLRAPRHAAAHANLERAQQQLRDEAFAPLEWPLFLRPLGWVYDKVALNEWATFALLCVTLAALLGIAGHWSRRFRPRLRPLALAALVLALCCLGMAALRTRRDFGRERAVVTVEEADVRSGPGSSYNLSFQIHEGLTVFVSERRGDWLQIHLGGQLVGWVPAAQIEII